jgi:hypothetical protein
LSRAEATQSTEVDRGDARRSGAALRVEWLPLLGLATLTAILFGRALFTGEVLFDRDIRGVFFPRAESFARSIAFGALPLWDPYPAFGTPLLADPSYEAAYPLTWLSLLMSPSQYYKLFAAFHCFLGGAGIYFLARRFGMSRLSSFVGGSISSSSGACLSAVSVWHHFAGASWIPWVILALDRVLSSRSVGSALVLGAVAAAEVLAGSGDMCLVTVFLGITYALWVGPVHPGTWRLVALGALALCYALALSAVQWMPTLGIVGAGSRLQLPPSTSMYWSVHPASLLDLLFPDLVSNFPMSPWLRGRLFEAREPFLKCLYLGVGAALMVGCARLGRRGWWVLFSFLFLGLASLGRHAPLFPLLLHFPFVSVFRYPVKCLIPAGLLWGLLVSEGVEGFRRPWGPPERRRGAFCAAGAVLLAAGAILAGRRAPTWATLSHLASSAQGLETALGPIVATFERTALVAALMSLLLVWRCQSLRPGRPLLILALFLSLGDLALVGRGVNHTAPPELATAVPPAVRAMAPGSRFFVFPDDAAWLNRQLVRGPKGWPKEAAFALGLDEILSPPVGGRWGLFGSFDGDFTGLAPRALSDFVLFIFNEHASPRAVKVLETGAVQYVLALHEDAIPHLQELKEMRSVFAEPIRLFEVPSPLPRTYVVGGTRRAPSSGLISVLTDPAFDPRREVVLSSGEDRPAPPTFAGESRITWRRPDAIALDVQANAAGYVVVVETFDSGWKAWVDGVPSRVLEANGLFRAVSVPSGRHLVQMRYRPIWATLGALFSIVAVLAGLTEWELLRRAGAGKGSEVIEFLRRA